MLAMIGKFVNSRVLSITPISLKNCAIYLFCSAMIGLFTVTSLKLVFSTFSTNFYLTFDENWSEKEPLLSLNLVSFEYLTKKYNSKANVLVCVDDK